MHEIVSDVGGRVDHLFCAAGSYRTLRGCADYIRKNGPTAKVIAVDAIGSAIFGQESARRLMRGEAILAGGTSGAVITAIGYMQSRIPADSTCALIFRDRGERYLSTICRDDWGLDHFGDVFSPLAGPRPVGMGCSR